MRNLDTPKENTWCPGCGNFGILNAVKKAIPLLESDGIESDSIAITCGIGCHGKIFDYLNLNGFYSLHGRAMVTAEGIKLANPDLTVIVFGGDGDSLGEGLEHTLFAAKRNMDVTLILHNNGTYGLTTGQFAPLSSVGYKGPTTPYGNIENPFNPLSLLLEAGATFCARAFSARIPHLTEIIRQAVLHPGFSLVEVLQPCVSFNNNYAYYNERVYEYDAVCASKMEAYQLSKHNDKIPLGVLWQETAPVYHQSLNPGFNPRKDSKATTSRIATLAKMFQAQERQ